HPNECIGHWNSPSMPVDHAAAPRNSKIPDRVNPKRYETEDGWLTNVRPLTTPAPGLNPAEAVWALVRRAVADTGFVTPDNLDRKPRRELRRIQLRPT
ncbi:hypothetical protein ACFVZ9_43095, partial [Streptomyces zaomyceticus]